MMIKELKKGNKAPYKGYLLGVKEYQNYQLLQTYIPLFQQQLKEFKEELQ